MLAPLLAQHVETESVIGFVMISLAYLGLTAIVVRRATSSSLEAKLIVLGLLTAVAASGYAAIVIPGGAIVAPTLIRISFLLVLGGIVGQLLSSRRDREGNSTTNEQESQP